VAIESARSNPCLLGDVVKAGICARSGERRLRDFQNALTIQLRVGPRLSWGCFLALGGHAKKVATGDILRLSYLVIRRHSPLVI